MVADKKAAAQKGAGSPPKRYLDEAALESETAPAETSGRELESHGRRYINISDEEPPTTHDQEDVGRTARHAKTPPSDVQNALPPAPSKGVISISSEVTVTPAFAVHRTGKQRTISDDEGTTDLLVDDAIIRNYKIGEMIARGAESVLYTTTGLPETLCVKAIRNRLSKVIGPSATRDSEGKISVAYRSKVRHIRNEFQVGHDLQQGEDGELPVVRIFGLRKIRRLGLEIGYDLIMEYIDGVDLGERHITREFSVAEKVDFFYQTAKALGYMHRKRYVHLDMKPSNIMVRDGVVKLIDFGVSVSAGSLPRAVTGTVGFLSPEQLVRDPLDEATDLFALGVTFAVIFGGHPLRQDPDDLGSKRMRKDAQYCLENIQEPTVTDIPEAADMPKLAELIRRCTIPQREKRLNTTRTVLNSLRRIAKEEGIPLTD